MPRMTWRQMFETVAKAVDLSALQVGGLTDRHEASESPERSLKELRGLGDRGAPFPIVPDSPAGPCLCTALAEGYRGSFGGEHEDCLTCVCRAMREYTPMRHKLVDASEGTDATGGRPGAGAGNGRGPREEARCAKPICGRQQRLVSDNRGKGARSGRGGVRGTRRPSVASAQPTVNVRRRVHGKQRVTTLPSACCGPAKLASTWLVGPFYGRSEGARSET